MKVYDNYEISPCRRVLDADAYPPEEYIEVCIEHEAQFWTLYGHINGEGVQAIGDFANRAAAEEVCFRITGMTFTGSYKADAHLRIMHTGQRLLEALDYVLTQTVDMDLKYGITLTEGEEDARAKALLAIAAATGRAA